MQDPPKSHFSPRASLPLFLNTMIFDLIQFIFKFGKFEYYLHTSLYHPLHSAICVQVLPIITDAPKQTWRFCF